MATTKYRLSVGLSHGDMERLERLEKSSKESKAQVIKRGLSLMDTIEQLTSEEFEKKWKQLVENHYAKK